MSVGEQRFHTLNEASHIAPSRELSLPLFYRSLSLLLTPPL